MSDARERAEFFDVVFAGQPLQTDPDIIVPTSEEVKVAAQHVLWVLDGKVHPGVEPGEFTTLLIRLICHADPTNMRKLTTAYPAYAAMVYAYKHDAEGVSMLTELAVLDTPTADSRG